MKKILFVLLLFFSVGFSFLHIASLQPTHFPAPQYALPTLSDSSKIELGRLLFYDAALSRDSSISCSSCHSPYNAFAHTDHDLSHGIDNQIGLRNAPALFNLAWQSVFMWDGAIHHIEVQAAAPISHPKEMGSSIAEMVSRLSTSPFYRNEFYAAFGDSLISGEKSLLALSAFQLSLVSSQSKYDKVLQGLDSYTPMEAKGFELFRQHCRSCHVDPLFSTYAFASNQLPVDTSLMDMGRMAITEAKKDSLLFKIPSLRNLSYSYPYMHDGRFVKLRQVLDHYSGRSLQSPEGQKRNLPSFTSNEKTEIIAFLLCLDDLAFVQNKKHQFPKKLLPERREATRMSSKN